MHVRKKIVQVLVRNADGGHHLETHFSCVGLLNLLTALSVTIRIVVVSWIVISMAQYTSFIGHAKVKLESVSTRRGLSSLHPNISKFH